jgi:hypothetical protein
MGVKKAKSIDPPSEESFRDGNYQRLLVASQTALSYSIERELENNITPEQLICNDGTVGRVTSIVSRTRYILSGATITVSTFEDQKSIMAKTESSLMQLVLSRLPDGRVGVWEHYYAKV